VKRLDSLCNTTLTELKCPF